MSVSFLPGIAPDSFCIPQQTQHRSAYKRQMFGSVKHSQKEDCDFTCHCHLSEAAGHRRAVCWLIQRLQYKCSHHNPNTTEWDRNLPAFSLSRDREQHILFYLYYQQQHKRNAAFCDHCGITSEKQNRKKKLKTQVQVKPNVKA